MIANPFDRIVGGSGAQLVCNSDGSISVSLASGKGFGLGANFQDIAQIAAPANPAAGTRRLFVDSGTGEISVKTSAGATVSLESGGGGGANTALSNLAAVSINASLIPQTTLDLGAAATPWRDLYLYGAGAFGAASLKITGTPTAARVITIPDATDTLVNLATIQTLVNKTLTSPVLTTPFISGAVSFPDGVRQTFNPDATTPGLNVGSQAGDPSTPANGDLWYDSTGNLLRARINGATVSLGAGGGSSPPFDDGTAIVKGSGDATKLLRIEVDGFTTGTTRVLTPPNANGTIAVLEIAQTFTAAQAIALDNATTNAVDTLLDLQHSSSGAPAAGFGSRVRFGLESSTTVNRDAASIAAVWTVVTDATRTAAVAISVTSNAALVEAVRIVNSNGGARLITIGDMGIGGNFVGLALGTTADGTSYTLLSSGSDTYLNAPAGGAVKLLDGNSVLAETSSSFGGYFQINVIPKFAGTNTTGAGTASLGTNSPAVTNGAPYTWIKVTTADGSVAYIPAWK